MPVEQIFGCGEDALALVRSGAMLARADRSDRSLTKGGHGVLNSLGGGSGQMESDYTGRYKQAMPRGVATIAAPGRTMGSFARMPVWKP